MSPSPPSAAPESGLGLGPRRSLRLASRSPGGCGEELVGSGDKSPEEREASSRKKGKRSRSDRAAVAAASPDERGGGMESGVGVVCMDLNVSPAESSSPEDGGKRRAVDASGVSGLDLNWPPMELSMEDGRREKRVEGPAVFDLNMPPGSILGDFEGGQSSNPALESRAVRRRIEVIDVDSDQGAVDVGGGAHGRRRYSSEEKGKQVLVVDSDSEAEKASFGAFLHGCGGGEGNAGGGDGWRPERRYCEEDEGKGVVVAEGDWLSLGMPASNLEVDWLSLGIPVSNLEVLETEWERRPLVPWGPALPHEVWHRRQSDREMATRLAPRFAVYKADKEEEKGGEIISQMPKDDPDDWPGPGSFSTAMKVIEERLNKLRVRQPNSVSALLNSSEMRIQWIPSCDREHRRSERPVPSLKELCLRVLSENGPEIESLDWIPDGLRHQLCIYLCQSRKMDAHVLSLLARGSPAEIRLPDCSWATEEQTEQIFSGSNFDQLAVLQLDLCGRCMPDYILSSTLCKSPDSLPLLTTISLRGAYRLSDNGLYALASSAPLLSSINLGLCYLVTSAGVIHLAEKLRSVLKELNLEGCQSVDALPILPALKNLQALEVLSVASIQTVNDRFVCELISVRGPNMKELILKGCKELTTTSVKMIGEKCPLLRSLDLGDLCRVNDSALGHLANGCTSIQKLKLRRNAFSDKAIAAFLEASGDSLSELSLNNVREVAHCTALSISYRCSLNLRSLDISFCRKMTDEALGFIVDSCSYLRILKLFGCRQITPLFLNGHSNAHVKIIGLEGPIVEHLETPCFL